MRNDPDTRSISIKAISRIHARKPTYAPELLYHRNGRYAILEEK